MAGAPTGIVVALGNELLTGTVVALAIVVGLGVVVGLGTVVTELAEVVAVAVVVVRVVEVALVEEAAQTGTVMVLLPRVTAPVCARTQPSTLAPVSRVADVSARIVPEKLVVVPRVAELPTCQNTLQACAPFSKSTLLDEAVTKVESL